MDAGPAPSDTSGRSPARTARGSSRQAQGSQDAALAELADDDALVDRLQGPAHGADLMLLESIDPRGLSGAR